MMVRLYSGEDGQSHFEEIELPAGPDGRPLMQAATGISFSSHEMGWFLDWHNAPRRQYVIVLGGAVEYGVGDGTVVRFGPGDILLAEDMTGHGHTSTDVGPVPRVSATVPLA